MINSNEGPPGHAFQSRNIRLDGKRTSIRLENALWEAFEEIAAREQRSIGELCAIIADHKIGGNLTAAVRLFIIVYFRVAGRNGVAKAATVKLAANRGSKMHSPLMASALAILE